MNCMHRSHPASRLCPAVHHPASCDCDDYQTGRVKCLEVHEGGWRVGVHSFLVVCIDAWILLFCSVWCDPACQSLILHSSNDVLCVFAWLNHFCCIRAKGEIVILLLIRQSLHVMLTEGFKQQTCRDARLVLANQKAERVHLVLECVEQDVLIVTH